MSFDRFKRIVQLYFLSWIPVTFIVGCYSIAVFCVTTVYSLWLTTETVLCRPTQQASTAEFTLCYNHDYDEAFVVDKALIREKGFVYYPGRRLQLVIRDGQIISVNPA